MFKYLSDKNLVDSCFALANDIIKHLQIDLARQSIDTQIYLIAETKEKLTCNKEDVNFDFDFVLKLLKPAIALKNRTNDQLKNDIKKSFEHVLKNQFQQKEAVVEPTTSGFSVANVVHKDFPEHKFFLDIVIFKFDGRNFFILKEHKNGVNEVWTKTKSLKELVYRIELVENEPVAWANFKERYLYWKTKYLEDNKERPSSFSCKLQALNDAFNKFWQDQ
ncbi:hypothetical protein H3143_03355 [Mycoplasma tullyi]|uniref:Uncharacterized protein n=1 Tax=Mycoplasma tullyi TaxID=1612150 RepID=A0A7D7U392_9MOLU|nr:hypothetical protein [Mycoplasma tullyi]QMT98509.1 hypothetical protein H3143_03355 [Mycoplasma tullyi]